jgi:hypothetical protein
MSAGLSLKIGQQVLYFALANRLIQMNKKIGGT